MGKWAFLLLALGSAALSSGAWAITDPTAPLGYTEPKTQIVAPTTRTTAAPMPRLDSILCREQCSAVISGELVAPGDSVSGYQVKAITAQQVTLTRGGRQLELTMFPEFIRQ
uniref:hypothetical protein n=1 Tax=Thaumasiovibrio occultus TaxID=1891184 RepID=UPI000B35BEF9|nr:hypothetical protein [Thaumasiovibrio occultus]